MVEILSMSGRVRLRPVRSVTVQAADELRRLRATGRYLPGGRIRAQRDLVAQLGISRPSVAEALATLEREGLITSRIGSGSYVTGKAVPAALLLTGGANAAHVFEARKIIEP